MSITNPEYTKHEPVDSEEDEPGDRHRGESNLSVESDKEKQEYVNTVPEDNASSTLDDGVQREDQDEDGFESAESDVDQPDNNLTRSGDNRSNVAKSDNDDSNIGGGGGEGGEAYNFDHYDEDRQLY